MGLLGDAAELKEKMLDTLSDTAQVWSMDIVKKRDLFQSTAAEFV